MKTYAWNFRDVGGQVLVLRAISQDSIGVLKLSEDGFLEFWHNGERRARMKSFGRLFKLISKIEKET